MSPSIGTHLGISLNYGLMGCSIASHILMMFSLKEPQFPEKHAIRLTATALASISLISALFISGRNKSDLGSSLCEPKRTVTVALAAVSLCNQTLLYFLNRFSHNEVCSSKK